MDEDRQVRQIEAGLVLICIGLLAFEAYQRAWGWCLFWAAIPLWSILYFAHEQRQTEKARARARRG